jgi:hypothetical protein
MYNSPKKSRATTIVLSENDLTKLSKNANPNRKNISNSTMNENRLDT